jgi:hypothetical protein
MTSDPIIERNASGDYVVSDIVAGVRLHRQYFGYTKREAIRQFKAYAKQFQNRQNPKA